MKITTRKVAIVGCGLVGSTTAFSLVTQGVCDEVMLIDPKRSSRRKIWNS